MHEGERIRRIRESLGLGMKYVADEIGISASSLSRLERGLVVLTYRIAVRLARLFNCNLDAFDEGLGGGFRPIVPPAGS